MNPIIPLSLHKLWIDYLLLRSARASLSPRQRYRHGSHHTTKPRHYGKGHVKRGTRG